MTLYAFTDWSAFLDLKPNEFADFLAGSFAPLAFLWLVLGFMQQGEELQHSAAALWLQGRELQNSVEQQRELVEVSKSQHQFEMRVREAQDMEADRLSRPTILLHQQRGERTGKRSVWKFLIVNAGAPCTNVRITYGQRPYYRAIPVLPTEGEHGITFNYESSDTITDTQVLVSFTDSKGRPGEARFDLIAIGEGFMKSLAIAK